MTVSSMLGRDVRKNRFRLDAVNSEFLDPLEEALGEKEWLFGDNPSTVDCLAVSVLTLMYMTADVPNPWLRSTLNAKHPKLAKWISRQSRALFGNTLPPGMSVGGQRSWTDLPWCQRSARSWEDVANAVIQTATEAMPGLGSRFAVREVDSPTTDNRKKQQQEKSRSLTRLHENQLLHSQVLMASLSLTTLVCVLVWKGLLGLPRRNPPPRFRNFGEAGNMLGLG